MAADVEVEQVYHLHQEQIIPAVVAVVVEVQLMLVQ